MALSDYERQPDRFEIDNELTFDFHSGFAFPCCVCKHGMKPDTETPCSVCGHNVNARMPYHASSASAALAGNGGEL